MILGLQRLLKIRRHDGRPRLWEVLQHWVIFSVVFEVVIPRFPQHFRSTADVLDVVAYLMGGLLAWIGWSNIADGFALGEEHADSLGIDLDLVSSPHSNGRAGSATADKLRPRLFGQTRLE
jgi:hypothetical protein